MARPERFELSTLRFVAARSIQLSYGRITVCLAEREGFEPSKGLQTPYSLSRGAPSATRPPLRIFGFFDAAVAHCLLRRSVERSSHGVPRRLRACMITICSARVKSFTATLLAMQHDSPSL